MSKLQTYGLAIFAFGYLAQFVAATTARAQVPNPTATPLPNDLSGSQPLPQQTLESSPSPASQGSTPAPLQPVEPGDPARNTANSYWLDNYSLNDLYQYLAGQANLQYFHNADIDTIKVTGQLFKGGNPLENMRDLALQYNLVLYQRGHTIYALKQEQVTNLPQQEFRYELKYLHPTQEEVDRMLGHFLTSDRAHITFEPKVNTIVVMDNESAIRRISTFLNTVDHPKRQISIQVRVLSINNTASKGSGVDWSQTLGSAGLSLSTTAQANLNSLFGFDPAASWSSITSRGNNGAPGNATNTAITVGPITVTAILRALYGNDRVTIENAPLVVTEDNEPANVSVVTRTPIITSTVTTTNGVSNTTNEVRYQIDAKDKTEPAQDRREIGTQLAVTPTILPDGTIRLLINGTVATQTSSVTAAISTTAFNTYPIINEAHIANLARLPAGYSLILGGFINESVTENRTKVPILGNIPFVGYAFRSKNYTKVRSNLVFIITPISYDANSPQQAVGLSEKNRQDYSARESDNYVDPEEPGHNADPNALDLRNSTAPSKGGEPDTHPLSERNPENKRAVPVTTREQQKQKKLEQRYRAPVSQPTPSDR